MTERGKPAATLSTEQWKKAFRRLRCGASYGVVAAALGVAKSTLHQRFTTGDSDTTTYGRQPVLSRKVETAMAKWVQHEADVGKCVEVSNVKVVASRIAAAVGLDGQAGNRRWLKGFLRRNPEVTVRSGEFTKHSRLHAINKDAMERYFDDIEKLVATRKPTHIWNMDEGGFDLGHAGQHKVSRSGVLSTPPHSLPYRNMLTCFVSATFCRPQVLATRGTKQVQVGRTGNRDRYTVCLFVNADGDSLGPVLLLKGNSNDTTSPLKAAMMAEYGEAKYFFTEAATQTEQSFALCIKYWCDAVGTGNLLIVDGHSSRVSLEALEYCRKSGNDIYTLPANSTHCTQPYDVGVARPFNHWLADGMAKIRLGSREIPGESPAAANVMRAVKYAVSKVTEKRFNPISSVWECTIKSAFRKSGLYPFNRAAVAEVLYRPAEDFGANVTAKRPRLSDEQKLQAGRPHFLSMASGDATKLLEKAVATVKRQHSVPECTLLTGDEHVLRVAQAALDKVAAAEAVVDRKKDREAKREVRDAEKAAAAAARVARKAAAAAANVGKPKRKREASEAPRKVRPRLTEPVQPPATGSGAPEGRTVVRALGKRAVVASLKAR